MVASAPTTSDVTTRAKALEPHPPTSSDASPPITVHDEPRPAPKRSKRPLFALALLVALGGVGSWMWRTRGDVSTDDAQIDADVVAVPAKVGGTVTKVLFEDNQRVESGQLLIELDDAAFRAKVEQAQANVEAALAAAEAADADARVAELNATGNRDASSAALVTASAGATLASDQIREAEATVRSTQAAMRQSTADRDRARALYAAGSIAKAEADRAETAFELASANAEAASARLGTLKAGAAQAQSRVVEASAKADQSKDVAALVAQAKARAKAAHAQVDTAKAALSLAQLDLEHTKIYAPQAGVLSKRAVAVGQTLAAGQAVAQLVTPELWVTANLKETQLEHLRVGQHAEIAVDAFSGAKLEGEVTSLSGATGSRFALLPPDNASGNFTKVVQRVPVRVRVESVPSGVALRPGMSVELVIHTRGT